MQVASLQAATSKLQQNISQLPEKRQRGHNWALKFYLREWKTWESINDTKFRQNRSRGLLILHCPVEVMHTGF